MREIKFRAWHALGKYIGKMRFEHGMIYDEKPGDCLTWKNDGQEIESIMQYTGLKDKSGREIYEGDIVDEAGVIGIIEYLNEYAAFGYRTKTGTIRLYKFAGIVIGNRYENPELLEVKP